jgi:hypothetical protein
MNATSISGSQPEWQPALEWLRIDLMGDQEAMAISLMPNDYSGSHYSAERERILHYCEQIARRVKVNAGTELTFIRQFDLLSGNDLECPGSRPGAGLVFHTTLGAVI